MQNWSDFELSLDLKLWESILPLVNLPEKKRKCGFIWEKEKIGLSFLYSLNIIFCWKLSTTLKLFLPLKCYHKSYHLSNLLAKWNNYIYGHFSLHNFLKNVRMSLDLWPPNNLCSPATKWGLSMVSGSQLQVAKLAQMCPAAPSGTQQRTTAPRSGQQCSAVASGNPGQNPDQNLGQNPDGAPWSTL